MQRPTTRIFWLFTLSLLGVIPILLTLAWVNGNMTLPGEIHRLFQYKLGWPWFSYEESSPTVCAEIDFLLAALAYLLTALVTALVTSLATRLKYLGSRRALTITVLGLTLFSVMSCWQYTGIIVWSFRWPQYFSDILYYALIAFALGRGFRNLDPYLLLLVAFFSTPVMSLDRLIFSIVTFIFLIILMRAIRFSELGKSARS
jgi:hypothetical protein